MTTRSRIHFEILLIGLLAAVWAGTGRADVTVTRGPTVLIKGSTIIDTNPTPDVCEAAAVAALTEESEASKKDSRRFCRTQYDAKYTKAPEPVDATCEAEVTEEGMPACSGGFMNYTKVTTWKEVSPAQNGGASCPARLEEPATRRCSMRTDIKVPVITPVVYNSIRTRVLKTDAAGVVPTPQEWGSFRLTCPVSHMRPDDPIVAPGRPGASHLHVFFGNASTDAHSTDASLGAAGSTCAGGTANRSAYWVPALVDTDTMQALAPTDGLWYYKHGYNNNVTAELKVIPNGLRMIAGHSATATGPTSSPPYTARFQCGTGPYSGTIPRGCTTEVKMELSFPNCWDGINLDSPDHRSHVRHSRQFAGNKCGASHPVQLPEITLNISYKLPAGVTSDTLRLASDLYDSALPGGYTLHGDVWVHWDEVIRDQWMNTCIWASKDCHAYGIAHDPAAGTVTLLAK
jgi:hypothetical protein